MSRKLTSMLTGIALLLGACGGSDTANTTVAPATTEQVTTSASGATTTTTTLPPTTAPPTTAAVPLVSPSESDKASFLLVTNALLESTVWSLDTLGGEAFVTMTRDGAIAACTVLANGGTLTDAAEAIAANTPINGRPPNEWTTDETHAASTTVLTVLASGNIYCPTIPFGIPDDNAQAAELITNAWDEFVERISN